MGQANIPAYQSENPPSNSRRASSNALFSNNSNQHPLHVKILGPKNHFWMDNEDKTDDQLSTLAASCAVCYITMFHFPVKQRIAGAVTAPAIPQI